MNAGVRSEELLDLLSLVCREVVGNHVNLAPWALAVDNLAEKGYKLGRGVPLGGPADDLSGLSGKCCYIPWCLYSKPCRPARPGDKGNTGSLRSRA